ncbi:MAG: 30S ribosomal protein S6 [Lentimicrobiaceae bacterium]|jgi:small subunit ribosomal protein S6|nr:30S ribosomal protein S6 [Lentimicrobiaceae bacterium]
MNRNYETVFILTPVLSEDQMKEAVQKIVKFLKEKGAKIIFEDNWGLRKLAYPIQKKSNGFYYLIEYQAEGSLIQEFELMLKRDEKIMRFLTVAMDKHAVAYSEKRRANIQAKKETNKVEN